MKAVALKLSQGAFSYDLGTMKQPCRGTLSGQLRLTLIWNLFRCIPFD
jgi:hypothetical protein